MPIKNNPGVDTYIAAFPDQVQQVLQKMRALVHSSAPDAEEVISYGMPAIKKQGVLVYYAAYAHHIGFYPTPSGIENFKNELGAYTFSKGAVQFPIDKPLPAALIKKIVQFRMKEEGKKYAAKTKK